MAKSVAQSSYEVFASLFDQAAAVPRIVYAVATDPPTRKVAKHISLVLVDLTALVTLTYGVGIVIQSVSPNEETEEAKDSWLSATNVLSRLSLITTVFYVRNRARIVAHIFFVTTEIPDVIDSSRIKSVCGDAGCTQADRILGQGHDFLTYLATEIGLWATGSVFPVLSPVVLVARTHHNGRYIIKTVLANNTCEKHSLVFLREHAELVFSSGVAHAGLVHLANSFIANVTGIPPEFYAGAIDTLMLTVAVGIASRMNLPKAPLSSSRLPDPVHLYQDLVAFVAEALAIGLEAKAAKASNNRMIVFLKSLPWVQIGDFSVLVLKSVYSNFSVVFMPHCLQSLEGLIRDPIVRDNWPALRETLVDTLKGIETGRDTWTVTIASSVPSCTGLVVRTFLGVPPSVTKLVLKLLNSDTVVAKANELRTVIENLQLEIPKPLAGTHGNLLHHEQPVVSHYPQELRNVTPAPSSTIRLSKRILAAKRQDEQPISTIRLSKHLLFLGASRGKEDDIGKNLPNGEDEDWQILNEDGTDARQNQSKRK